MIPKVYNPFEEISFTEQLDDVLSSRCWLYMSDLIKFLECESDTIVRDALSRALRTMLLLNIPVRHHIKEIYKTEKGNTFLDYRLSSLAVYLTVINTEPINPTIARAQVYFVR